MWTTSADSHCNHIVIVLFAGFEEQEEVCDAGGSCHITIHVFLRLSCFRYARIDRHCGWFVKICRQGKQAATAASLPPNRFGSYAVVGSVDGLRMFARQSSRIYAREVQAYRQRGPSSRFSCQYRDKWCTIPSQRRTTESGMLWVRLRHVSF